MQSNAFDVETGAALAELDINVNYADHHGTPSQVSAVNCYSNICHFGMF